VLFTATVIQVVIQTLREKLGPKNVAIEPIIEPPSAQSKLVLPPPGWKTYSSPDRGFIVTAPVELHPVTPEGGHRDPEFTFHAYRGEHGDYWYQVQSLESERLRTDFKSGEFVDRFCRKLI